VITSILTWHRQQARWQGPQPLTFRRNGLQIKGTSFTAPTDLHTVQITAARARLSTGPDQAEIQGRRAVLNPAGLWTLRPTQAWLRRSGKTVQVTAPNAQWDPAAQSLQLQGGIQAQESGRKVRMQEATWSASTGQFVGTGSVVIQEGTATLQAQRLEADPAWQTLCLTPVRLSFRDPARAQSGLLRADEAVRQSDGRWCLQQVSGTVADAVGPIQFTAETLHWSPREPVVTAQGNVHLQSEAHAFQLQAATLEWNRDTQRITARGEIQAESDLGQWSGVTCWVYDLVSKTVELQ